MDKYRKALFTTNIKEYPFLFLQDDGMYKLIKANGMLSGDGFESIEHFLKYFPKAEIGLNLLKSL